MADWGKKLPEGMAQGIAIDDRRRGVKPADGRQGTICAQVQEVSVSKAGQIRSHRVDMCFESGFGLANPLSVRKNIEGQLAWGIGDILYHQGTIEDGAMVEVNFDKYNVARMHEYPKIVNIEFLKTGKWIEGAGEEAIPTTGPAMLNAAFKITGKRLRSLTINPKDLAWGQS
jgi:isoquinoline 1-oxidoreductase beta subunit